MATMRGSRLPQSGSKMRAPGDRLPRFQIAGLPAESPAPFDEKHRGGAENGKGGGFWGCDCTSAGGDNAGVRVGLAEVIENVA
jgi:hypothetical protein